VKCKEGGDKEKATLLVKTPIIMLRKKSATLIKKAIITLKAVITLKAKELIKGKKVI
jgi:hypothetical protein